MPRRVPTTLTDYVVVGINPTLIMLLIASVVFFLVEVFYQGDYNFRLKFIFFMFIMGAVAVGRLSMEEGSGYAATFGMPLGIVAFIGINTFVTFEGALSAYRGAINLTLIAMIWYLAMQLTWDCTLLDERTDTADQGLLAAIGAETDAPVEEVEQPQVSEDAQQKKRDLSFQEDPVAWWLQYLEPSKLPHAHGVSILYFACIALPLFGIGGWFLPTLEARQQAFGMLALYVTSSLALLLSTSFLGLRRYLRLRNVEMPLEMTATWLGVGTVLIVVVLFVSIVLPRPGAEVAISKIPFPAISPPMKPSNWSWGNDGRKERDNARASSSQPQSGEGEASASQPAQASEGQGSKGEAGDNQTEKSSTGGTGDQAQGEQGAAQQGSTAGSSSSQGGNSGSGESSNAKNTQGEKSQSQAQPPAPSGNDSKQAPRDSNASAPRNQSTQQQQGKSGAANQAPRSPPNVASMFGWLGTLLKLIFWAALFAAIVYYGWKHRHQLAAAWQKLLAELQMLWERSFGTRNRAEPTTALPIPPPVTQVAFSEFQNPFTSGRARTMSPRELLHYTFQALEAYGREVGCPRAEQETPHEFGERLVVYAPALATDVQRVLDVYGYAAYAGGHLPASAIQPLQAIWQSWTREAAAQTATAAKG